MSRCAWPALSSCRGCHPMQGYMPLQHAVITRVREVEVRHDAVHNMGVWISLQHAVVTWVREHAGQCEVIHGHEWGGVLVDVFTVIYFRRLPAGIRSVVTPHGGHMWSLQWKPQRSLSVEPLRIDHQVSRPLYDTFRLNQTLYADHPLTPA